jgi:hypothetical protein
MADQIIAFDERTGQRILKAVRFVEAMFRGGAPGRGRYPIISPSGLVLCRIGSGGFTARAGGTLGTGTVTRYETDGDTVTLAAASEPATSSYYVAIDGDRDCWCAVLGDKLSLVTRHCQDPP